MPRPGLQRKWCCATLSTCNFHGVWESRGHMLLFSLTVPHDACCFWLVSISIDLRVKVASCLLSVWLLEHFWSIEQYQDIYFIFRGPDLILKKSLYFFPSLPPPSLGRENLQKLPQLAAIHHNNCMYIAHHLLTLGHQFRYRLTNILYDGAATFVDLVPGFRRLGNFTFETETYWLASHPSICNWVIYNLNVTWW